MTEPAEKLKDGEGEESEEEDYGDGDDGSEELLLDGETYFYGGKALFCETLGAVALDKSDGVVMVGIMGKGMVALGDALKAAGKPSLARVK